MANTYDFYKPQLASEYPEVDGPLTITSYVTALDQSYTRYREKYTRRQQRAASTSGAPVKDANVAGFNLTDDVDYPVFHSPYGKLVQKAHARLLYNDFRANPSHPAFANVPSPDELAALPYEKSVTDKSVEKTFIGIAKDAYKRVVDPSMRCAKRCGNMYTGSLYGGLASLVSVVPPEQLLNKRISMFAFGSGSAASFYAIRVKGSTAHIRQTMDLLNRLQSMKVVPCEEYVEAMKLREANHNAAAYQPKGELENLWPGSYYLTKIDEKYRRFYAQVPESSPATPAHADVLEVSPAGSDTE
jgi:hydroxymethylglutaryl-CoA synthase